MLVPVPPCRFTFWRAARFEYSAATRKTTPPNTQISSLAFPRYKHSHTQSAAARPPGREKRLCLSRDCQMRAFTVERITTAHIYPARSVFLFCLFLSSCHSSVRFPCAHSSSLLLSVSVYLFLCLALLCPLVSPPQPPPTIKLL